MNPHFSLRAVAAVMLVTPFFLSACGESKSQGGMGLPPAMVSTMTVQATDIPVAFEYVGQTTGSKEVEVRARVTGILGRRHFSEGNAVKSGQLLFTIDPSTFAAQAAAAEAELARAQAQRAQAEREAARLKPLAERRAVGQKEADDAQSSAELAAAAVKAAEAHLAEARLNLGYTRVAAPVSGLTSRAAKSEGSLLNANETLLTTISQLDPIWIRFYVSENEQLKLAREAAANRIVLPKGNSFDVTVKLADDSIVPRKGAINFADPRINPATGTYEMRAEFANPDGNLKPGQFVRVKLAGAYRKDAIAVPQAAVLDGPQGKFVYVPGKDKDGKDVALPRPVVVGDWTDGDSNRWVVESGLKPGDAVIVDGIARVMFPGQPIQVVPPGTVPGGPPGKAPTGAAKK